MKYELTDEYIVHSEVTKLYRIRALKDFNNIKKGDLGGFIEKEGNLSHHGNAWVGGNAQVFGNAKVFGYAKVSGDAFIQDKNHVFFVNAVGSENGTLTVFTGKNELLVTRGCLTGTVDEFLKKSKEVHDETTHREYQLLIEVAKSQITNPYHLRPQP